MSDQDKKSARRKRTQAWLVAGVIVLIVLLFFWADIVDMMGGGMD